jgi:hypothetical protein
MSTEDAEEIRAKRKCLKEEYGKLYDEFLELLFRHDPIGINFEDNQDEYAPEVGTILPRLKETNSPKSLQRIIHQEFVRWFSSGDAGPESAYEKVAEEMWSAWQRQKQRDLLK